MMVAVKWSDYLLVKTEMTGKLARNGEKTNGSNWFGLFPFSPKSQKFRLEIKWNGPFWYGPTGIFGTTFEGAPL